MFVRTITLFVCLWLSLLTPSFADSSVPQLPKLDAAQYLLVDFLSGTELAAKDPDKRIEPASITKLMTAYLLYQELDKGNIKLEDRVLVSEKAWQMEGSRMFLEIGKKVPLERMISGLIIQSGNDAAVALAEHSSGSEEEFVRKMNAEAARLGLTNTHFMNVTGWPDPNHYMSARDIAKLTRTVIKEYPEHYKLYSEKEYSYNGIKQYNRNKLLWHDKTVDGVKTGHTESAGYCLLSSAQRGSMRLIAVVLGAESDKARTNYSQQLLEYGFRFYETHKLYDANSVLAEARVWKGEKSTVPTGIMEDFYVTIPKGHYSQLKGLMEINKSIDAPVKRGDLIGMAVIKDVDRIVLQKPLVAMDSVDTGGTWTNITDSIKKLFVE
ncbi:D-alanyl-D-alanine carboxypeptidase family protein [Leucothrix mucor]|mgnify:CR=1 FL=1|jgi:D-alanyl-D-alanine carboxypeptidase (penicillin-binding protein 5/6)|uniref:D-alanyl-D-alanine carboxypeptidase family protein n=1 Tax=Leucothrix mucor TaxID=45248 RepID=UPI0003B314F8|nr:D-alanyl-D-alanine carboxypeptidase family protein [Leucothrix mucor]